MGFIEAIQHATIGYDIRRKAWPKEHRVYLDGDDLTWVSINGEDPTPAPLMGEQTSEDGDDMGGISAEDIVALDWECPALSGN